MMQTKTMADLICEHEAAMVEYNEAKRQEDEAHARMAAAINRLNTAQKAIDGLAEALRKQAPWNTEWHSRLHPGKPVTS